MSGFVRLDAGEDYDNRLRGNLDVVDERNLTEAQPKDLIIGNEYLILDRETNEKTIGKFTQVATMDDDESDDETGLTITRLAYVFEDPHGEILIGSNTIDDDDINPFNSNIKFTRKFGVFIPKAKEIVISKVIPKKIPEEILPEISKYGYGGKSRKTRKSRKSKKSKKSKKSRKSRKSRK